MSKKRISQETFDAAVKENIDDFGLSVEDAIRDTVKEFEMQGIDLSNIVTSAAKGEHEVAALSKRFASSLEQGNTAASCEELNSLLHKIPSADEGKIMAVNNGVIKSCCNFLQKIQSDQTSTVLVFRILYLLVADYPLGRDKFWEETAVKFVVESVMAHQASAQVQELGFRLIKAATSKKEATKAAFMQHGGLSAIKGALKTHMAEAMTVRQIASVMYTITNADDFSTILSKVFDTAKDLVSGGVLPLIYDAIRVHSHSPEVLQDLFAALKGCAIQNDIVQGIVKDGGLQLTLDAMRTHMSHSGCAARCMLLLANMAENDDVKKDLCQGDAMPLMLAAMQHHASDSRALRAGCTAIASLALRMPDNCEALMSAGAGQALLEAMRTHPLHSEVNRTAMIALRNLVVRNPEHRPVLLEDGAEELVRRGRDTHARCADAAFDCLRDLGCEYGGLGDRAGHGEHSAYVACDESLVKRGQQVAGGSAMISWEEDDS